MNDLYLIGNGFDLAHGLKTTYNDFLLWYLNNSIGAAESGKFSDALLEIDRNTMFIFEKQESISQLLQYCNENLNLKIIYKNSFFENIVGNYQEFRWVDIEYEYYSALVENYREAELNPHRKEHVLKDVRKLNSCLWFIKSKLIEYLKSIEIEKLTLKERIEKILFEGTGKNGDETGEKMYVYFNYTSTIDLYTIDKFKKLHDYTVYIHGKLNDRVEHIIFGYGDEIDPYYEKIENLNANEFLDNIKSFYYLRKDDYQYVIRFLEEDEFCVKVLGHSCGLSDRILLSSIFEHSNCKAIKIYYYQKNEKEDDYFVKTQEISRHFKASKKSEMRMKIVPFDDCEPLIPFNKQN